MFQPLCVEKILSKVRCSVTFRRKRRVPADHPLRSVRRPGSRETRAGGTQPHRGPTESLPIMLDIGLAYTLRQVGENPIEIRKRGEEGWRPPRL